VANGGQVGFALRAGTSSLFQFTFSGGTNFYLVDAGTAQQTAHGFTAAGMRTTFTLTGANTFNFSVQFNDNQTLEVFSGTLASPGGTIDSLRLFASNGSDTSGGASDVFYNNMAVVPEPSSLALLAGPAILGAWFVARRRRS
jgi:hypothetical protein